MASPDRVSLLDVKLEFTQRLTPEELAELSGIALRVVTADRGPLRLDAVLQSHQAFAATVLDGIVVYTVTIGEQSGIQLLGPGDLLLQRSDDVPPPWFDNCAFRAVTPTRLALLGGEFMWLARRVPDVIRALYESAGDQMQRLSGQLVICQLPRVEQRVLAVMWLLAQSWGQVTPAGVRLPLALTHETIGALIGARRPTVTLAIRKLTEEGSIIHQDSGWLLLQPPPESDSGPGLLNASAVELADVSSSRWAPASAPAGPSVDYAELSETVRRLREQHVIGKQRTREQLTRTQSSRLRTAMIRDRISRDALSRRWPPSS
jgi:CRP/FNR family transcriptional regulator, cyclic AMP receptor protein